MVWLNQRFAAVLVGSAKPVHEVAVVVPHERFWLIRVPLQAPMPGFRKISVLSSAKIRMPASVRLCHIKLMFVSRVSCGPLSFHWHACSWRSWWRPPWNAVRMSL